MNLQTLTTHEDVIQFIKSLNPLMMQDLKSLGSIKIFLDNYHLVSLPVSFRLMNKTTGQTTNWKDTDGIEVDLANLRIDHLANGHNNAYRIMPNPDFKGDPLDFTDARFSWHPATEFSGDISQLIYEEMYGKVVFAIFETIMSEYRSSIYDLVRGDEFLVQIRLHKDELLQDRVIFQVGPVQIFKDDEDDEYEDGIVTLRLYPEKNESDS